MSVSFTALASGIAAIITAVSAFIYNRWSIKSARDKFVLELEDRRIKERAEDLGAQREAAESIARVSEQMATTTYGFIDRLQSDVGRLQEQIASERVSHNKETKALQERIAMLENEIIVLKSDIGNNRH